MIHITRVRDVLTEGEMTGSRQAITRKDGVTFGDFVIKIENGEERKITIPTGTYILLPTGKFNRKLQNIVTNLKLGTNLRQANASNILATPIFTPIEVPKADIGPIRKSYIDHYKSQLGEEWSEKDFQDRLDSLSYRTYKYARDEKTGKVIVVGFFGAQIATGAGGKYLTNAELYVLPQFRGQGIATELVNQSFGLASEDGIKGFDSLTYRVPGYNALGFWEGIGASVTELIHIAGDIDEMRETIAEKTAPQESSAHRKK